MNLITDVTDWLSHSVISTHKKTPRKFSSVFFVGANIVRPFLFCMIKAGEHCSPLLVEREA